MPVVSGFSKKTAYDRGKFLDEYTYSGLIKTLMLLLLFWTIGWFSHDLIAWVEALDSREWIASPEKVKWRRMVISIFFGLGIVKILINMLYLWGARNGFKISPDTLWDEWELHQQWKQRQQAEAKRWKKRIKIELHEPEEEPAPPAVPAGPVDVPISSEHEIRLPGMDEGVMRETGALPMRLEVPAGQDATASPKLVGHYHSGTNRIVLVRKHQGRASSKGWHRGGQCRGAGKSPAAAGRKKGPRGVRAKRNTTDRSRSYCRKKGKELSWPGRRCRPWRSGHPDWT